MDPKITQDLSSSFDFSNFIEFDEWEERARQQNRQVDRIIKDVFISIIPRFPTKSSSRARRLVIEGKREEGEARLFNDYFFDDPTFPNDIFRRRFRMRKDVFLRIVSVITANALGRLSISLLQKCTAAIKVLAYGTSTDAVHEYLRISETVTKDSLLRFVEGAISHFGNEYLKKPNTEDFARLFRKDDKRGFPRMLGSIDCMNCEWKNCPKAWAGQFAGRSGKPTLILEAVASSDLWIWHAFFETPSTNNDINVLHKSPIFDDILEDRAPEIHYVVNGCERKMRYYLTHGIYPAWAVFVKSINAPKVENTSYLQTLGACQKRC